MQIDSVYVGEIRLFSGNFAPDGWAFCDGRLLDISTYTPLFTIIGNRYGGNGITNFALPDLRGRVPVHFYNAGIGEYSMNHPGQKGGNSKINLTLNQLPNHLHTAQINGDVKLRMQGANTAATSPNPTNAYPATVMRGTNPLETFALQNDGPLVDMAESTLKINPATDNVTVNPTGTGADIDITPPYLTIGYIIAIEGIMPHAGNLQEERLTGLTIAGFQTVPAFNPDIKEYIINIPATQNNITIIPTADTDNATITINSIAVDSGKTQTIALPSGSGIIKTQIDVLSRDGVVVTYGLASYKGMPQLNALTVDGGIPTTKFVPCIFEYMVYADTSSDSIILTPSANIANAVITINNVVAANNAPFSVTLQNSQQIIYILVTSSDKTLMTKYVLNVKKTPLLSSLNIDSGKLMPGFAPTVFSYLDDVGNLVDKVGLTPTAMDPDAKIVVSSNEGAEFISVASGEKALVDLAPGKNSIVVGLSSKDNANTSLSSFYRINIQRNDAQLLLNKLVINKQGSQAPCPLSPGFEPWVLNYTLYFTEPCVVQVAVSTREYYNASITIQGVKVGDSGIGTVQLNNGENIITIKVATESISTEYKIIAYVVVNEAYLTNIKTSIGQLQPAFLPNVQNYKLRINYLLSKYYLNLYAYCPDSAVSIMVDGTQVLSGQSLKINLPADNTSTKTIKLITSKQKYPAPTFCIYAVEIENDPDPLEPQIVNRYAFYDVNDTVRAYAKSNLAPCRVYCIIQILDTPLPSKTQVVNGLNGKGQTALFHANSSANATMVAMFTTNRLQQGVSYQVCFVAQDMYGRNSEVSSVLVSVDKDENELASYL